jgi:hydroxymethylpyrimidine/phosphomethylpyrimidine kinase
LKTPVALTIAGSDPSGGAGLQADLKTFHQHRVYGMSVVTLLTVQNTQSVSAVEVLEPAMMLAQLDAVLDDIPPDAAKTGALGNSKMIAALGDRVKDFEFPLIIDPVMISKHGAALIDDDAISIAIEKLFPHAFLVTPNLAEASRLTNLNVDSIETMEKAAIQIADMGPNHVLVKGGHLEGDAIDVLWSDGKTKLLKAKRLDTPHTHGTGCVTSAAITARVARGETVLAAVEGAKQFISKAIKTNPGLGKGFGPVNLFAE